MRSADDAASIAATFGCMAVGSLLWGAISDTFSIQVALALGGLSFGFAAFAGRHLPLPDSVPLHQAAQGAVS